MGFASAYLEERALFPEIIKEAPDRNTGIIIVVPAYDEPGISRLLDSLFICNKPPVSVEVIVVINAPEGASSESISNNELAVRNIEAWQKSNIGAPFRLYTIVAEPKPVAGWGVGLARKTGMDEAVRRFNSIDKPGGAILNLDADCQVDKNYLAAIHDDFLVKKDRNACSLYFEHPLSGNDFPKTVYDYITLYELHLRYYLQGLLFSGFPWVFHTVGSAIGVKTLAYVKAGGMNRKQAGEDFYFIQKLVPAGGYFTLNTTTVYPSPRPSFRVPFGTGASISKMAGSDASEFLTYDFSAFRDLRSFFIMADKCYSSQTEDFPGLYSALPEGIRSYVSEDELAVRLEEIRSNTSGFDSYRKRFFGWFNMFRVVKYLNHVHSAIFEKKHVVECAAGLLKANGILNVPEDPVGLLLYYRSLERGT